MYGTSYSYSVAASVSCRAHINSMQIEIANAIIQKISNRPAAPMPPPTHMVTTADLAPRLLPSMSTWPTCRDGHRILYLIERRTAVATRIRGWAGAGE